MHFAIRKCTQSEVYHYRPTRDSLSAFCVQTSPATNYVMNLLTVAQHRETEMFSPIYVERQHLALNTQTLKLRFGTIQTRVHESIISARTAHNDPCVGKRQKLHLWSSCQDPKHKTPSA